MAYLDNIAVFVRVVELGNLSAAGRDMRISPAVASNRIKELEKHLGVRLFNRTTRQLMPTEHGNVFYEGAKKVLESVVEAEAAVSALSGKPKGSIRVTAPLGLGRRLIASGIPEFHDKYPDIQVRLRLSDHNVDILKEGIDVAFRLGLIEDSSLRMRGIMECERVLAAAPAYLEKHGEPAAPGRADRQEIRLPDAAFSRRARAFLDAAHRDRAGRNSRCNGPYDSDDGDVITEWALGGRGIINKPRFEMEPYLRAGRLRVDPARTIRQSRSSSRRSIRTRTCRIRRSACCSTSWPSAASA